MSNDKVRAEFEAWANSFFANAPTRYKRDALPKDDPNHGDYASKPLQVAWLAWQASRAAHDVQGEPAGYVRPHHLEMLRSGKVCGVTIEDRPDERNGVTVPLYAAQQPVEQKTAPDVAGLVDLLRDIGDVCRQLEMPSERAIAEWADRIDAALSDRHKQGGEV